MDMDDASKRRRIETSQQCSDASVPQPTRSSNQSGVFGLLPCPSTEPDYVPFIPQRPPSPDVPAHPSAVIPPVIASSPSFPVMEPVPSILVVEPSSEPEVPAEPQIDFQGGETPSVLREYGNYDMDLDLDIPETGDAFPHNPHEPLYQGAPITLHESFVSLITLSFQFKLTGVCLQAIMELIQLHLPKDNNFKATLFFIKKYFSNVQGPKDFEYYCSSCFQKCEEGGCLSCKGSKICYIVKLSLLHQLETLFARTGFYSKLNFSTKDRKSGTFSDIYDGTVYRNLIDAGLLGKEPNISFQWYTDGAALFKSSNMSVWPLYFTINELPYAERFHKENVLVPVLWCGTVKPPGNLLLLPLISDLQHLSRGVSFNVKGIGLKSVRACVISGTGDTPARALMMNMVQHNGEFSCQKCEQKGQPRTGCPGVRIFPYSPMEMTPRTSERMINYGLNSSSSNHVMGCKGQTLLQKICPDFVSGSGVDVMHQTYGGVWKTNLQLLTSSDFSSEKWSASHHRDLISKRLKSIKPPSCIPRLPRSLEELSYMKISELKFFCLSASLPVFDGILHESYLAHLACLVAAIQLLNADVVTKENINTARDLLKEYVSKFCHFYDENFLTLNFHLLLHSADLVEELGPGWVYSCFLLESINGVILSLVQGTKSPEKQIASSVELCLKMPDLVSALKDSESKLFCQKLLSHKKINYETVGGSQIHGKIILLTVKSPHLSVFLESKGLSNAKVMTFHSLKKGICLFVASSKKRSTLRDSRFVTYRYEDHDEVGIIHHFYRLYKCHCQLNSKCTCDSLIYAEVQRLVQVRSFPTLLDGVAVPNIHEYNFTQEYHIVPQEHLVGSCTKMEWSEKLYIAKPTNTVERE